MIVWCVFFRVPSFERLVRQEVATICTNRVMVDTTTEQYCRQSKPIESISKINREFKRAVLSKPVNALCKRFE